MLEKRLQDADFLISSLLRATYPCGRVGRLFPPQKLFQHRDNANLVHLFPLHKGYSQHVASDKQVRKPL